MTLQLQIRNIVVRFGGARSRTNLVRYFQQSQKMSSVVKDKVEPKAKSVVAIAQMRSTNDKMANLLQVKKLVSEAKSMAANYLFLPECCDFVAENREETLQLSEPLDKGSLMQEYRILAKENEMWLSLGGIHELILDEKACKANKIYNSHVLINNLGEVVAIYRKLHLFDVDTPEFRFRESAVVEPGPGLVTPVTTTIGKIGLQICYDMRFAETSLLLRKSGAQILTYPSAFAYSTGKAHWEILLRARAIENQCYVLAAAQVGHHNSKRRSWGHAMALSPWGEVLADCGGENDLCVKTVEIDLSAIDKVINNMPCFNHRRSDVYSLTAYNMGECVAKKDRCFADHIIQKETIFYESKYCFAFTNIRCVVVGHVLVSTKRCTPRLNGLNCEEMTDLFSTVCMIQRMLESYYDTTAATVTVQDGTGAGQTVPHVHFHVMPRRPGDFPHNDQVYTHLDDRCEDQLDRDISERIDEARRYREFLNKQ